MRTARGSRTKSTPDIHHAPPAQTRIREAARKRSTFLPVHEVLAVKRLVLVDKHGRTRAELGTDPLRDGAPTFSLYYSHGRFPALSVSIQHDANGVERPVIHLEATDNDAGVMVELDENGLPRILLLDQDMERIGQMTCADIDGSLRGLPNLDECEDEEPDEEEGATVIPLPVTPRPRKPRGRRARDERPGGTRPRPGQPARGRHRHDEETWQDG